MGIESWQGSTGCGECLNRLNGTGIVIQACGKDGGTVYVSLSVEYNYGQAVLGTIAVPQR